MTDRPHSSRRDFLSGKAVQKELRQVGDKVADEIAAAIPVPVGSDTVRLETRAMGCPWCVIMNPGHSRQVMVASDALEFVYRCEDQLTIYRDDSDAARLNQFAGESPQPVDGELFGFLMQCRVLWEETDGAFDCTAGAVIQLWKRCRHAGRVPSDDEIADSLSQTGMQHVELVADTNAEDGGTVRFQRPQLTFDFGAIGKGAGIDRAVKHLDFEEVTEYLIHGGQSSLFARGTHTAQAGWPVGIKNPLFTERRYVTILLRDQGMSTSGSNIQYFRHQGRRYGHILDPRTGWPAESLLSVTVVAPTATQADAVSTAFYAMGLDNALRYCDDNPDIGAILIPHPQRGRTLEPIVRNIPEDRLFFEPEDA